MPPPRYKKKVKMRGIKNLNLESISHEDPDGENGVSHQNDILFNVCGSKALAKREDCVKGHINFLSDASGSWRRSWVTFDTRSCLLTVYSDNTESQGIAKIDTTRATFLYDLENDGHDDGLFKICTPEGVQSIDVGSAEKRIFWLDVLQKSRRSCNSSTERLSLKSSQNSLAECEDKMTNFSDAKDLQTPMSAGYLYKKTFFPSFPNKNRFKLTRSESERRLPPAKFERTDSGLTAWEKLRKSFKPPGTPSLQTSGQCRELDTLRTELQFSQEEVNVNKDVISSLHSQVAGLEKERDTLIDMQPNLQEGQLLTILREKDHQIVKLESQIREKGKVIEMLKCRISKAEKELSTYAHIVEVKDMSIVKLSNDLHEFDLNQKIEQQQQATPLSVGVTGSGQQQQFVFCEKVSVGSQTETQGEKQKESLQDMVAAFLMQNKFLNKEVLELNQLRQQAMDREQKLFLEASDWEAKFYQIQSKYLLLLNELHNPQVMVSASRQEMVGHLLKDIVESSEKPTLTSENTEHDRFGFRFDNGASLVERAERLQRIAEENLAESELTAEEVETRWKDVVVGLGRPGNFLVNKETKALIRRGVPINLRGSVWRAIIINRIRGNVEGKLQDYYQALLSNYNPGLALSPAAKQIELDLLRTLPNNIYYENNHSKGIPKLRRVLLAYSLHNPELEYCQGFNRIAAIALLFLDEEEAFWCLLYILEVLLPETYYKKQMVGAQVDQSVLKELLCEKLPKLAIHFESHGVDPALFSLNWFLCLFVEYLPVNTYLHIWDAFLFEGSKVLFRYALAIFKCFEEKLLRQSDYMSIFNCFRAELQSLFDIKKLTKIAFQDLNPFPLRVIKSKREHHQRILKAQMESLEVIRQDYRKNSVKSSNSCVQSEDEEEF